jgi:hypothetical protein
MAVIARFLELELQQLLQLAVAVGEHLAAETMADLDLEGLLRHHLAMLLGLVTHHLHLHRKEMMEDLDIMLVRVEDQAEVVVASVELEELDLVHQHLELVGLELQTI